jgi:localization factor PodJL
MSNSESTRKFTHPEDEAPGSAATPDTRSEDLADLLNTIVAQLADADRVRSETVDQMQEKLAGLGRGAETLRSRVSEDFSPTFDKIEASVAELSSRLADQVEVASDPLWAEGSAESLDARDYGTHSSRYSDPDDDTFDVIDSSSHRKTSDPWRRDTVEALASHYDAMSYDLHKPAVSHAASSAEHAWLEARFNDIAARIEQSLAEFAPSRELSALGARFDRFDERFAKFVEQAATKGDVEGLRLLEAHVSEIASNLEHTHDQLMRLSIIEAEVKELSKRLDDVHHIATLSDAATSADLRPIIERFITESRQGGEQTAVQLDTLQQAMIRLLDRVDAMEPGAHAMAFAHHPSADAHGLSEDLHTDAGDRAEESLELSAENAASDDFDTVMADVPPEPTSSTDAVDAALDLPSPAEVVRQDIVADLRRAKMKLMSEKDDAVRADKSLSLGVADVPPVLPTPEGRTTKSKTATAKAKKAGPTGPSTRLVILAVILVGLLTGMWLTMYASGDTPPRQAISGQSSEAVSAPSAASADVGSGAEKGMAAPSPSDSAAPASAEPAHEAPPVQSAPDQHGQNDVDDTYGEIVPGDVVVGATSVPLNGVTVDAEKAATADAMQRAARQRTLAHLSGRLGDAASRSSANLVTPAALIPQAAEEQTAEGDQRSALAANSAMSMSRSIDMPPATVGPLSLRLAAANGDAGAEFEVGARLAEGGNGTPNFADAAKWYQRSASRGFAQAQYRLGTLYERGLGLKADAMRAESWYRRAAEQGNIKAMHNLAVLNANQSKNSPDYMTAAQWFTKAAERGLADSQFNLAVLYENGLGVQKNLKEAFKWLSLAARGGDAEAIRRRDIMRGKLTVAELADAEGMVKLWRAAPVDTAKNDARRAWQPNQQGISG